MSAITNLRRKYALWHDKRLLRCLLKEELRSVKNHPMSLSHLALVHGFGVYFGCDAFIRCKYYGWIDQRYFEPCKHYKSREGLNVGLYAVWLTERGRSVAQKPGKQPGH